MKKSILPILLASVTAFQMGATYNRVGLTAAQREVLSHLSIDSSEGQPCLTSDIDFSARNVLLNCRIDTLGVEDCLLMNVADGYAPAPSVWDSIVTNVNFIDWHGQIWWDHCQVFGNDTAAIGRSFMGGFKRNSTVINSGTGAWSDEEVHIGGASDTDEVYINGILQ